MLCTNFTNLKCKNLWGEKIKTTVYYGRFAFYMFWLKPVPIDIIRLKFPSIIRLKL